MYQLNWGAIRAAQAARTMHRPDNIGALVTLLIFYKNLHDHFLYGKPKMDGIMNWFGKIQNGKWPGLTGQTINKTNDANGMDANMYRDYMHRVVKIVEKDDTYKRILGRPPIRKSEDKKGYLEAAEVTYKLTSFILCTKYKFDKRKLNLLQRYVKNDMWALIDGNCKLTEFFWMLHTECRLEFGALDGWMKRYGKIYGEDGMPI